MLLMGSQGENNDMMWTVSSDSFPFHGQLMESYVSFLTYEYQVRPEVNQGMHCYSMRFDDQNLPVVDFLDWITILAESKT